MIVRDVKLADWGIGFMGLFRSPSSFSGLSIASGEKGDQPGPGPGRHHALRKFRLGQQRGRSLEHGPLLDRCTGCSFTENGANGLYSFISGLAMGNRTAAGNGEDRLHFQRAARWVYDCAIRDHAVAGIHVNDATGSMFAGTTIAGNPIGISEINGMDGGGRTIYNDHFNNTVNTNPDGGNAGT